MAHMTTGSATAKHKAVKRGKATSMHIRRASNGFTATTHHEAPASSRQQMMSGLMDSMSEDTVHHNVASLKKHVAEKFGGLDSDEGLEGPDKGDAAQQASVPMG